jgi:hypothetical protein
VFALSFSIFSVYQVFMAESSSNELDGKNGFDTKRLRRSKTTVFVLRALHKHAPLLQFFSTKSKGPGFGLV